MRNRHMEAQTIACDLRERINEHCTCPKNDCPRHGLCCQCIVSHRERSDVEPIKRFPHCLREMIRETAGG